MLLNLMCASRLAIESFFSFEEATDGFGYCGHQEVQELGSLELAVPFTNAFYIDCYICDHCNISHRIFYFCI